MIRRKNGDQSENKESRSKEESRGKKSYSQEGSRHIIPEGEEVSLLADQVEIAQARAV